MRILVDPSTFDCRNMGDVAMLQVALARLRATWAHASIEVITDDPAALAAHAPGVTPVPHAGRQIWFTERYLLGGLHDRIPPAMSDRLVHWKRQLRRRRPALVSRAVRWRMRARGDRSAAPDEFLAAVRRADLLVVSGAATLADDARKHALLVLNTIELARDLGRPVAMFSQGIGPVRQGELLARMRAVLPWTSLVAVREGRGGPPLLAAAGVPLDRVIVTGDDAVEMAYTARADALGPDIGINLRTAQHSGITPELGDTLRPALHAFARERGVGFVPLPIAFHRHADDPAAIRHLLTGFDGDTDGGASLRGPADVIAQVRRCRIVVTAAYHAAVFALSQGVPTVCLARTPYYVEKYLGLAAQFGPGGEMVRLDGDDPVSAVVAAMQRAWASAESVRASLLDAAARQSAESRAAYERLHDVVVAPATAVGDRA